ncbi:FadR/GntR family transcriptional regulator [Rugosimonospora africana]|uniref:GntR family transcriptional regulator n=1 Tax=Rugosimonospora africana TaxID=556532 RepID=A0A8J3VRE3_9ACTN|nr:FadR/GntR family transcriptional regulator [Rugosimonospora africana]GIH15328.1 GntR family transcriptional regulator [Rugosimonospora africana]
MPVISRDSLVDQAIDWIRGEIASGRWAVGSRLPAEPVLAVTLGVSRNTVREAVRSLAHTGLLQVRQGDGTFVKAPTEVEAVLRQHLKTAELIHVFEARRPLEAELARLAARRRTPDDLTQLAEALARRDTAEREHDREAFVPADVAFHQAIAVAAHNPVLETLYRGFAGSLGASIEGVLDDEHLFHRPSVWHHRLYDTIAAGDEKGAARAATAHLTETLRTLSGNRDPEVPEA